MDELFFDAEKHEYWLGDMRLPSVTEVLREAKLVIPKPGWNQQSRDRGTAVHAALEYEDADELDESTIDERIVPYLDAYREWKTLAKWEGTHIEERVYHPDLWYAGTIDRLGRMDGQRVLLDIKTGSSIPEHADIQTFAYWNCLEGEYMRAVLLLKKNGRFKLKEVDGEAKWPQFQKGLEKLGMLKPEEVG